MTFRFSVATALVILFLVIGVSRATQAQYVWEAYEDNPVIDFAFDPTSTATFRPAVLKLDEAGGSQQITEFQDGEIIGESSLLEQEKSRHRRSATIVAKSSCSLLSITRKAMLHIVENYPDIRQQLQAIHDDRVNGDDNSQD